MELLLDINGKGVPITKIKNMFIDGHKCLTMVGKPKLFFIQACRASPDQITKSNNFDSTYMEADSYETDGEDAEQKQIEVNGTNFPHKSWFLVFHSTIRGFVSKRDPFRGSIFIQELCKEFRGKWLLNDIGTMAGKVNRNIMKGYNQIQAPIFENQLGDLVYFNVGSMNR